MSKIVLIKPKNDVLSQAVPLSLLHIGTVLSKEGYDIIIIDAAKQADYKELISNEIKDALIVGITSLTTEVTNAIEISDYIKNISDLPIIWGGCHPTLFPEQVCSDKSVDFVCVGEGEYTMLELVKALESGTSFENINGLVYKDDGSLKINPPRKYVNMEELPAIDYDLVDLSKYIRTGSSVIRAIEYQSSRGCPHRCKFCINAVTGNQRYRAKSPEKTVNEIQLLIGKYDFNYVEFVDDNFFVNIKRAREVAEQIIKRNLNIKWFAECRPDYFRPNFVDEQLLNLAQKSGLSSLTIGAEAGSQRVLDLIGKDTTVEQIVASAKILRSFNITAGYSFIVGLPDETKEEIIATIKLAQEIYRLCPTSNCGFVTFTPYPRCELTDNLVEKGFFEEPRTLRGWTDDNVRELYYGRFSGKPWHENPKFIDNVIYFSRLAYNTYSNDAIKKSLKYPRRYPGIFLSLVAKFRMKYLFFAMPIDKVLYKILKLIKIRAWLTTNLKSVKDKAKEKRRNENR